MLRWAQAWSSKAWRELVGGGNLHARLQRSMRSTTRLTRKRRHLRSRRSWSRRPSELLRKPCVCRPAAVRITAKRGESLSSVVRSASRRSSGAQRGRALPSLKEAAVAVRLAAEGGSTNRSRPVPLVLGVNGC